MSKRLLSIRVGGAFGMTWDVGRADLVGDALPVPPGTERFRTHVGVGAVVAVAEVVGNDRDAECGELSQRGVDAAADGVPSRVPGGEFAELDAADGGLDLGDAPVGAEGFVDVAEAGWVVALKDGLVALAVVFVGPGVAPHAFVVEGEEAAFAGGGEDLVLAEAEGGEVAEGADGSVVDGGAMGLCAVFDDGDVVCACARSIRAAMSTGQPPRWTGTIALVRGVMAASTAARSRLPLSRSTSARTGVAPRMTAALALAMKVRGVVMTSSPRPMPSTPRPRRRPRPCWRSDRSAVAVGRGATVHPLVDGRSSAGVVSSCGEGLHGRACRCLYSHWPDH